VTMPVTEEYADAVAAALRARRPSLNPRRDAALSGAGVRVTLDEQYEVFFGAADGAWGGDVVELGGGEPMMADVTLSAEIESADGEPDERHLAAVADGILVACAGFLFEKRVYRVGERVELAAPVERFSDFTAEAGARGRIEELDAESFLVSVKMDEEIEGAGEWDNCVVWSGESYYDFPFDVRRVAD
jgi:hypothetical protein